MLDNTRSTFELTSNLEGRIRNLALAPSPVNSVYPLLEAIMNGIQAIQDRFGNPNLGKGKIQIRVSRTDSNISIEISDNGIGLNNENFGSFLKPDSDLKIKRGGKGVGRLTWLKTFKNAHIISTFKEGGTLCRRMFDFKNVDNETISNHKFEELPSGNETGTIVRLLHMRGGYAETFPAKAKTITSHIIRHFLPIFISGQRPEIIFFENDKEIDIASELERNIDEKKSSKVTFTTTNEKEHNLNIVHMRIRSRYAPKSTPADMMKEGSPHNAVYFAADQRVGFEYPLDNQLGLTTFDKCKYVGILEGEFLNSHMNQERTFLDLPPEEIKKLKDAVYKSVTDFLTPFMERVKEMQKETFTNIEKEFPTLTSSAPENFVENLPYSIVDIEEMLASLAKYKNRKFRDIRAETTLLNEKIEEAIQEKDKITIDQEQQIIQMVDNLRTKLTKETNASLADLMLRRKAVITLLDRYMGVAENGKHIKEDLIHTLICPMQKIDNERRLLENNLWLLDDRFAFYSFLASDKALNQYTPSTELGRPDVLFVLDEKLAFGHEDTREAPVFIVEFKRPNKGTYRTGSDQEWDKEDPFDRFLSYRQTLQSGISGEKTHDGRRIEIPNNRPFHCFLIADMTKNLKIKCETRLSKIEGSNSYFGYVPNIGFIHAISYEDLINNAKIRHDVFFKTLGIAAK